MVNKKVIYKLGKLKIQTNKACDKFQVFTIRKTYLAIYHLNHYQDFYFSESH